mmetsp:Transcript_49085/g.123010  ORF Transcript_49085/g.123010 Transcript_49085/m.123010 type:complete len:205 (-) Transcript_49085:161-775(-)
MSKQHWRTPACPPRHTSHSDGRRKRGASTSTTQLVIVSWLQWVADHLGRHADGVAVLPVTAREPQHASQRQEPRRAPAPTPVADDHPPPLPPQSSLSAPSPSRASQPANAEKPPHKGRLLLLLMVLMLLLLLLLLVGGCGRCREEGEGPERVSATSPVHKVAELPHRHGHAVEEPVDSAARGREVGPPGREERVVAALTLVGER